MSVTQPIDFLANFEVCLTLKLQITGTVTLGLTIQFLIKCMIKLRLGPRPSL